MNKTESLFVNLQVAVEFRRLGFNEPCIARFYKKRFTTNFLCNFYNHNGGEINKEFISAPLIQQVVMWMKEKYGVELSIFDENINDSILNVLKEKQ